jgi:hypothetical protein
MKIALASLALISLSFVFPLNPSATSTRNTEGASVSGSFEIFLEKGAKRRLEFHAVRDLNGNVSGETIFRDDVIEAASNKSTEAVDSDSEKPLFLKAEFDCLTIEGNRAVMVGSVTQASKETYVGRRVLTVAQENGGSDDPKKRDKVSWGIYRNQKDEWLALDSERPEEQTGQTWLATDLERHDDEGVPSTRDTGVGCQSFPISSFSFIAAHQGRGTVHVKE